MNCFVCDRPFRQKKNLYVHLRKIHKLEPDTGKAKIICPKCNANFTRYVYLRHHLWLEHQIEMKLENIQFKTVEEFYEWKRRKEKEMKCFYALHAGTKAVKSGSGIKQYFVCHRSGSFVSKSSGQRCLKRQGSCKVSSSCPSTLLLTKLESVFEASLWTPHVGHNNDLVHLKLTREDRESIAVSGKIAEDESLEKVLGAVHEKVRQSDSCNKLLLVNKQDLRNIRRGFSLDNAIPKPENCATNTGYSCSYKKNEETQRQKKRIEEKLHMMVDCMSSNILPETTIPVFENMLDNCIAFINENVASHKQIKICDHNIQETDTSDSQIVTDGNEDNEKFNRSTENQPQFQLSKRRRTTKEKPVCKKKDNVKLQTMDLSLTKDFVVTNLDHTYIKV